jgi:CheY-like chemotaxis protein
MRGTVLICDDSEQMRGLIATVLRRGGYEVREVASGEAALRELAAERPDLAILDVQMPGIDGLAVLEAIRGDPTLAGIKVLILSGSKEALEEGWGERVGADAHLAKPFAVAQLDAAVRSLLDER